MSDKILGVVKWYSPKRKYGFISGDDKNDYFIHKNELIDDNPLLEQDRVIFYPYINDQGFLAKECKVSKSYDEVDPTDVLDYLKNNKVDNIGVINNKIICSDGFTISVQASRFHYSIPRENLKDRTMYTHVEVSTSASDSMLYPYSWNNTKIYSFVPVQMVQRLINKHGGIKKD